MDSYKEKDNEICIKETVSDIIVGDSHTFPESSEGFNGFVTVFRQQINAFAEFFKAGDIDQATDAIMKATNVIRNNMGNIFSTIVNQKEFLEILEDVSFIEHATSILMNGITPLCISLIIFIQVMTSTFNLMKDYFSQIDLFGALCDCIVNYDDSLDPEEFNLECILNCMNTYVKICAAKYNPTLSCLFDDINDIICWLTCDFKVYDVIQLLFKVCSINTVPPESLSLIPVALIDVFREVKENVGLNTTDSVVFIEIVKLFSIILDKNPQSCVIFQNRETNFFGEIATKLFVFKLDTEGEIAIITFIGNYNKSILLSENDMALKEFPTAFYRDYIYPIVVSLMSSDDTNSCICAANLITSVAMINTNLLYDGLMPQTIYDFCIMNMKKSSIKVKVAILKMMSVMVMNNDFIFINMLIKEVKMFEICTDAAGTRDLDILSYYLDFLKGTIDIVTMSDSLEKGALMNCFMESDIVSEIESICDETEEEIHEKAEVILNDIQTLQMD